MHREAVDEFAALSQARTHDAWESGRLAEECFAVEVKERRKTITFDRDEHPRADSNEESLARLRPAFKEDGVVTAGNASGINDGAAALGHFLTRGGGAPRPKAHRAARLLGRFWV